MDDILKRKLSDELAVSPDELTHDKRLEDIESWDSVAALNVMIILGDELGIPIMPNEMKNIKTFGDIEHLVQVKRQKQ